MAFEDLQLDTTELILFAVAIVTGILTGLLGAGGGFLIMPALMIFYRLDAKKAVGTSLFIITLNALAGFVSELGLDIQWSLLLKVTLLALLGSLIGQRISAHLDTKRLRESFGWFILVMALVIITTQSFQIFNGRQH